jgi:hypothetical protein
MLKAGEEAFYLEMIDRDYLECFLNSFACLALRFGQRVFENIRGLPLFAEYRVELNRSS